jgi:spore coat polysaccharide biosynthesis predicted glycosyltransferase SpsG
MDIAIRCDAGGPHGYGHARRMLGLARALAQAGTTVTFWTRTPALTPLVQPFEVCGLGPPGPSESQLVWSAARRVSPDVLVIDHKTPYPEEVWEELRRHTRVVRIDHPYAEAKSCDLLIIPNVHQPPTVVHRLSRVFEDRLCYGTPYALLDADIGRWRQYRLAQPTYRLVMVAGASDPSGALAYVLEMTADLGEQLPDVWMQYLVGAAMAAPLRLTHLASRQQVVGFHPRYLVGAGLVLTLFGVMPYNLLHLGVPTMTLAHTRENAEGSAALMAATGATVDLGYLPTLHREDLCAALVELWADAATRKRMAYLGPKLIDGLGAARCAEAILALGS